MHSKSDSTVDSGLSMKPIVSASIAQLSVLLILAWALDVRPQYANQLATLVQLFSIDILRTYSTWEIIYYLHAQPPLLNFITSIAVTVFDEENLELSLHVVMLGLLIVNILLINLITNTLKISQLFAWLYMLFPAFFLFHTWYYEPAFSLFFTNLVIFALAKQKGGCSLIIFTTGLAGLSICHGIFQPLVMLFFLAFGGYVFFKKYLTIKNIFVCIIIASVPVLVAVKNYSLIGLFGTSSWSGCNIAQKWPNKDTWVLFPLKDIKSEPNIIGAAEMSPGKPNYNHIDFGRYCIQQFKTIVYEMRVPKLFGQYLQNVAHTVVANESKLSLFAKRHCCGLGGQAWGKLDAVVENLISFERFYGPVILFINILLPLALLFPLRKEKYFKEYIFVVSMYYFSLLVGHMANGQEQERMGFRNSLFVYLCVLYSLHFMLNMFIGNRRDQISIRSH
jgi:hypothetical protein